MHSHDENISIHGHIWMKIRIPVLFWLPCVIVCFSSSLMGQEPIRPEKSSDAVRQALLDFTTLEDVPAFLQQRRIYIEGEVAEIHERFLRHKQLPTGVTTEIDQPFVLIDGRKRPDLFDHGTVLSILFGQLNSGLRDTRVAGLIARGFRPDDIWTILSFIDDPDYPQTAQRKIKDELLRDLRRPAKTASDEAILAFLRGSHQVVLKTVDTWATEVLNKLPLRARRVVFSYAYEVVVPKSHMTQATSFTRQDIDFFRNQEE